MRLAYLLLALSGILGAQATYKGELVRHEITTRTTRACPTVSVGTTGPTPLPPATKDFTLTAIFACDSMDFTGPRGSLGEISWTVPAGPLQGEIAADNTRIEFTEPRQAAYSASYRGAATLASASTNPPRRHNVWVDITPSGFPPGTVCAPTALALSTNAVGTTLALDTTAACQFGALQISRILSSPNDPLTEFEARVTTTVVVDSGHVNVRCCAERGGKVEVTIHSIYKFEGEAALPPNPHQPGWPTDTRFVRTEGAGLNVRCASNSTVPLRLSLGVTRAVGKLGANDELDDAARLIADGVVTRWARLRIPVGVTGAANMKVTHTVTLNGTDVDYLGAASRRSVDRGAYELLVIDFPISAVRFPARAAMGSTPAPRDNEIVIASVDHNGRALCVQAGWVELRFGALAPVIMVHGNGQGDDGAGGKFWEGEVLESAGRPRFNMGFRFVDAFEGIPHDNSISMPTGSTDEHGVLLANLVPAIAGSFGARHAHLVAHSKGGLDSRAFMVQTIPANFGVLSLTTLSTPHQGSPGPDYQIDSQGAWASYSDDSTRTKIGKESTPNAGTASIRVSGAAEFNARNVELLPRQFVVDRETDLVAYRSISADMNLDDSQGFTGPTIQHNETFGLGQGDMYDTTFQLAVEQAYRLVGYVISTYADEVETTAFGKVKVVRERLRTDFHLNDVAVTRESANCWSCAPGGGPGPFRELAHLKRNHSTIAHPDTGRLVLNEIRNLQPMPLNP